MGILEALVEAIKKETDSISEILSVVVEQRDAARDGNLEKMQGLIKALHSASLEVQKYEAIRDKAAESVASELGCEKTLSAILEITKDESLRLAGAALTKVSNVVSAESKILKRLVDERQKFNEMMLSELRRFDTSGNFTGSNSSMDLKG